MRIRINRGVFSRFFCILMLIFVGFAPKINAFEQWGEDGKLKKQNCNHSLVENRLTRGVPILIPEVAKAGIAYIASSQAKESVGINSRYLFATVGSEFRLYECLAEHCEKADLSHPQRITATALRKYMATITQALDLKPHQIEWVMRHMGHSLDVHTIYYRSTSDIIERTQVAKIVLLQDTGMWIRKLFS